MNAEKLARKIARDIFTCGKEFDLPVTRLEFKSGELRRETAQGGLCENALAQVIKESLKDLEKAFGEANWCSQGAEPKPR